MDVKVLKYAVLASAIGVAGCDKVTEFDSKLSQLNAKVVALESKVAALEVRPVNSETWVMWKRFVDRGYALYTPFLVQTAFADKKSCMDNAQTFVVAGGKQISYDPLMVEYPNGNLEFSCLPKGVAAGVQNVK